MAATVGIGAIGVGGRLNALLKRLLARHGNVCELRGICNENQAALDITAQVFGKDMPAYRNYAELLERRDLDWILIGSMNYLHHDHCVASFAAGKHVFCEKPIGITVEQCEAVRNAHRAAGTLFATGFVLRYAPLYEKIQEMVASGSIGKIVSMEVNENLSPDHGGFIMRNWRRHTALNGPHLLEKSSHDIDLVNWIVGDVAARVASFGGLNIFTPENKEVGDRLRQAGDKPPLYQSWPVWEDVDPFTSDKDVEDNQVVILEYCNGVRVTFHSNCCAAFPQRRMLICGLEGTLEADLAAGTIRWQRIGRHTRPETIKVEAEGRHGGGENWLVDELVQCMQTGEAPRAGGDEDLLSTVTCLAIDQARRTNRVVDLEPYWQRFGV